MPQLPHPHSDQQSQPPTTLTVPCPTCGPQEFRFEKMVLRINRTDHSAALPLICPSCAGRFSHPTCLGENLLLATFGIDVEYWTPPAEQVDRLAISEPLTHAEMVGFAAKLAEVDQVVPLLQPPG